MIVNEFDQVIYHGLKSSQKVVNGLDESVSPDYLASFKTGQLGRNKLTGRPTWLHLHPIGTTGWKVLTVINIDSRNEQLSAGEHKAQLVKKTDVIAWIAHAVVLSLTLYLWVAVIRQQFSVRNLWRHAFIISLILTLGIVSVWVCVYLTPSPTRDNSLLLSNRAAVGQFQDDYTIKSIKEYKTPLIYIPTGIFVQSI